MGLHKFDKTMNYIQSLDDNPNISGMDARTLKAQFDKAGTDIKDYLNNKLTEELDTKLNDIGTLSNLETTTKTDVVSAINEVNGKAADYIIETGTTDGWKWRKWNSGRVEINGWVQYSSIKLDKPSQGTYYNETTGTKTTTLPISLSSVDYIGVRETSSRSSGTYVYNTAISGNALTIEFRAFGNTNNGSCGVQFNIIGTI